MGKYQFRTCLCAISLFLVSFVVYADDSQVSEDKIVFQVFSEATRGMHPKEVKNLRDVFDDYSVIDLEKSGFTELALWLDRLTTRYTKAIEGMGDYFPEYRVSVIASKDPVAFIYKFRIPGQRFYRGHVYFSTGMIHKMKESMEYGSKGSVDTLLAGLRGVIGHEFIHPKQDELIKWEWREGNDWSITTNGQGDESATDLMTIRLSKKSNLPTRDILTGLELVYGYSPQVGSFGARTVQAIKSSHTQEELRLNIVRGGLVMVRRDEGKYSVEPIRFNKRSMIGELEKLLSEHDLNFRVQRLRSEAERSGGSTVIHFLNGMMNEVKKSGGKWGNGSKSFGAYIDWLPFLDQVLAEHPKLTPQETEALKEFFKKTKQNGINGFNSGLWIVNGSGQGGRDPVHFNAHRTRQAQKVYPHHRMFKNEVVTSWIDEQINDNFWDFTVGKSSAGLHYMPVILPADTVKKIYWKALDLLDEKEAKWQGLYLVQMLYGIRLMGVATDLEIDVLTTMLEYTSKSDEVFKSFVLRQHNMIPGNYAAPRRRDFTEAFVAAGERRGELIGLWADYFEELLRRPDILGESSESQGRYFDDSETMVWDILYWREHPEKFLKERFLARYKPETAKLRSTVAEILRSEAWQQVLEEYFVSSTVQGGLERTSGGIVRKLFNLFTNRINGFSIKDRETLLDALLSPFDSASPDSSQFKGRVMYEVEVIGQIIVGSRSEEQMASRRAVSLATLVRDNGHEDILGFIENLFGDKKTVYRKFFNSGHRAVMVLSALNEAGLLDDSAYREALDSYVYMRDDTKGIEPLTSLRKRSAFRLWKSFRDESNPRSAIEFLEKVAETFRIQSNDEAVETVEIDSRKTRDLKHSGVKIAPGYGMILEHVRKGLAADFRRILGITRKTKLASRQYSSAFVQNYGDAKEFLTAVFNPDSNKLPVEYRDMVKYHHLDSAADTFTSMIPAGSLDQEQRYELWQIMSAKRANRSTDVFFETYCYPALKELPESLRRSTYSELLTFGMLRSERLRNQLVAEVNEPELKVLEERASQLEDGEVYRLIQKIVNWVPGVSRFRDKLLDRLSWRLELSEAQLHKFTVPLRSFNFQSLNPLTVNLLSGLAVLMGKLNDQEKMELISYFQNPIGSIRAAVPAVDRLGDQVNNALRTYEMRDFDWVDSVESFVRDAGEGDRLVLIEMLVGSRRNGLWYKGAKVREQLYTLAGLEAGSLKRKLFETHLVALPQEEHSVAMSYLMAIKGEEGESELMKIHELFDTPGGKFAQIAAILAFYGPEYSEELEQSKANYMPAARHEIFELFKKRYTDEQYLKIKRVRKLLGSGSIKYVVLVEYTDGTTAAVYTRRPYLDEKNEGILDIVQLWAKELEKDPEFAAEYDFEYYLTALRQQLADEVQFKREFQNTVEMGRMYEKVPKRNGWKYRAVKALPDLPQTDTMLHFTAVENAVPFEDLSPKDQKDASELVIDTELGFLFRGDFDADPHLGNHLFDPVNKLVYRLDQGQRYQLKPNKWFRPGDRYEIARLLHGFTHADPTDGAEILADTFLTISENFERDVEATKHTLSRELAEALSPKAGEDHLPLKTKMFRVLGTLNRNKIRLPLRFSMGVIMDLMKVTNEKYAKAVDPSFIESRIAKFIKTQLVMGARFKVQPFVDWCERLLLK